MLSPSLPPVSCTTTSTRPAGPGPTAQAERARKAGTLAPQASSVLEPSPWRNSRRVGCMPGSPSGELEFGTVEEELERTGKTVGPAVLCGAEHLGAGRGRQDAPHEEVHECAGAVAGAMPFRLAQATGSNGPRPSSSLPQTTSDSQLLRASSVALLTQARPPSQPFTLGGWNKSCPCSAHVWASTGRLTEAGGASSMRRSPALNSTGLFTVRRKATSE